MYYDPIKNVFASVIKKAPYLRVLFYKTIDLMFLRSWYVRRELRIIRKEFGSRSIEIYDAGTGYAQYSYFMAKHLNPCNVLAVDVKREWIEDASIFFNQQNIKHVKFAVEDLTRINYKSRFDLIICVDVMEHIEDDVLVFSNYFNALKPGGYLLINTPSIFGGSDVHDDDEESFIGEHARDGYSHHDLTNKLVPLGFKVHQYKYTYGFWGDKAWRLGIKYPMQLLNFSKLLFLILPLYYLITFPVTFLMMYFDFISNNKIGSGINFIARKP